MDYLGLGVVKITAGNNAIDENCPLLNAVIPMGLGIRSQITNNINVFLQAERVQGLNDCLDGLDVNNTAKDVYSMIKVGLSYGISGEGAGVEIIIYWTALRSLGAEVIKINH